MRKTFSALLAALALSLAMSSIALGHVVNDGTLTCETGREYALDHIVHHAQAGSLGAGGHVPGAEHQGYAGIGSIPAC